MDIEPFFKAGDPPPKPGDYNNWHAWATVQMKAGLRQRKCPHCKTWRFPQEKCCDKKVAGK